MDKVKITNHQFFSLSANVAFGGVVIVISSAIAGIAKQDAWISAIITPIYGLLILKLYCFLGNQYPNMTLVEIILKIFGKWLGCLVVASFIFFCFMISIHMPWSIGTFITSTAMPVTPVYVIIAVFVAVAAIGILYGLETFARTAELFIYFVTFFFILLMIFNLPNARIENILPVFEKGISGSIKGSIILIFYTASPLITILMIYPVNANDLQAAKKSIYIGYLWSMFLIFIGILMSILVLGAPITAESMYPTYLLAKEINIGIIFTRFEFIIAAIWFVTFTIIFISFFYAEVIGLSQLLGLKDYRKIVLPLGLIILVMTEVNFPNKMYETNWISHVLPPYVITHTLVLPVALFLTFWVKKWIFKKT